MVYRQFHFIISYATSVAILACILLGIGDLAQTR
jgi:hypothetical protein